VQGLPAQTWLNVFFDCFEWHWDGGQVEKQAGKNRVKKIKTGFYHRLCLPDPGTVLEQHNLVMQAFGIIKDEEARIMAQKYGR